MDDSVVPTRGTAQHQTLDDRECIGLLRLRAWAPDSSGKRAPYSPGSQLKRGRSGGPAEHKVEERGRFRGHRTSDQQVGGSNPSGRATATWCGVLIRQHSILGRMSKVLAATSVESQMLRSTPRSHRELQTPNQMLIAELAGRIAAWQVSRRGCSSRIDGRTTSASGQAAMRPPVAPTATAPPGAFEGVLHSIPRIGPIQADEPASRTCRR